MPNQLYPYLKINSTTGPFIFSDNLHTDIIKKDLTAVPRSKAAVERLLEKDPGGKRSELAVYKI